MPGRFLGEVIGYRQPIPQRFGDGLLYLPAVTVLR
jgi:hypothetical protein